MFPNRDKANMIYFKYVRNPCLSRENPWGTTPSPCWSASITTKAATFSSKRSSSAPSSRPSIFRMSCELRSSTFDLKNIKGDLPVPAELTKGENSKHIPHSSSLLCSPVSLLISSKKSHTSEILRRIIPRPLEGFIELLGQVSTQEPSTSVATKLPCQ